MCECASECLGRMWWPLGSALAKYSLFPFFVFRPWVRRRDNVRAARVAAAWAGRELLAYVNVNNGRAT